MYQKRIDTYQIQLEISKWVLCHLQMLVFSFFDPTGENILLFQYYDWSIVQHDVHIFFLDTTQEVMDAWGDTRHHSHRHIHHKRSSCRCIMLLFENVPSSPFGVDFSDKWWWHRDKKWEEEKEMDAWMLVHIWMDDTVMGHEHQHLEPGEDDESSFCVRQWVVE